MPSAIAALILFVLSLAPQDPNAPKKPMGSYFIFIGEMREEVKKDFPDLKPTEMSTKLSELWKV